MENDEIIISEKVVRRLIKEPETVVLAVKKIDNIILLHAKQMKDLEYIQSISRVSKCINNGSMESFQGIMKDEIKILYSCKTADKYIEALQ